MEGILSIAASSMIPTPKPVLPEPVIPIIAACVVKFLFLRSVNASVAPIEFLSISLPR